MVIPVVLGTVGDHYQCVNGECIVVDQRENPRSLSTCQSTCSAGDDFTENNYTCDTSNSDPNQWQCVKWDAANPDNENKHKYVYDQEYKCSSVCGPENTQDEITEKYRINRS